MAINKRRQKQGSARAGRPKKFNPQLNMKKMQDKMSEETKAIDVDVSPAYLESYSTGPSVTPKSVNLLPHSPPVSTNNAEICILLNKNYSQYQQHSKHTIVIIT